MNLLEHEGKALFKEYGIRVPQGMVCLDTEELGAYVQNLEFPVVIKAQVPVGGRGKARGIATAMGVEEALDQGWRILGMKIHGHAVQGVLVEEMIAAEKEVYIALVIDLDEGLPVLLVGIKGGIDVERVPMEQMRRFVLNPLIGLPEYVLRQAAEFLGLEGGMREDLGMVIRRLWRLFQEKDCELVEINPLMLTASGEAIAVDAKVIINDDALPRHPEVKIDRDRGRSAYEKAAAAIGLSGVELDGSVAVMANGAGLTMAVLDAMSDYHLRCGAFLDLGGTDDPKKVQAAMGLLLDRRLLPHIRGILVCVFGGVTKCDSVAEGILSIATDIDHDTKLFVRLRGVNETRGRTMLREAGINEFPDLGECCRSLSRELEVD